MNLCWPNSKVGAHLSRQNNFSQCTAHGIFNTNDENWPCTTSSKSGKQPFGWSSRNCPMTQPKIENAEQTATQDTHPECKKNGNIQFWRIWCWPTPTSQRKFHELHFGIQFMIVTLWFQKQTLNNTTDQHTSLVAKDASANDTDVFHLKKQLLTYTLTDILGFTHNVYNNNTKHAERQGKTTLAARNRHCVSHTTLIHVLLTKINLRTNPSTDTPVSQEPRPPAPASCLALHSNRTWRTNYNAESCQEELLSNTRFFETYLRILYFARHAIHERTLGASLNNPRRLAWRNAAQESSSSHSSPTSMWQVAAKP